MIFLGETPEGVYREELGLYALTLYQDASGVVLARDSDYTVPESVKALAVGLSMKFHDIS